MEFLSVENFADGFLCTSINFSAFVCVVFGSSASPSSLHVDATGARNGWILMEAASSVD